MLAIDDYGECEERGRERYERRKERTMISDCHLKDWDSDCVNERI